MKKLSYLFWVVFVVMFSSCETQQYSCDPIADEWVKQNMSKVKTMTRASWLQLNESETIKRAAYVAFSPKQQRSFWEDKTNEVINQYKWNEKEKEHLLKLLNYIKNSDMFSQKSINEEAELFIYKWNDYAINELQWSKSLIYAIAGEGNRVIIQDRSRIVFTYNNSKSAHSINTDLVNDGSEFNCSCSSRSDFCDIFGEIPDNVVSCNRVNFNCKVTKTGCGLFWMFPCNGICKSVWS